DLYPDWAPDWTFAFHEEDGTPEAPLVYKPLPGHNVPGEASCIREEAGLSVMDFYMHFLQGNLISEAQSTGCLADHMKRGKVIAHGASRTHQIELAFYQAEKSASGRGPKRASLLNHPSLVRQDPESALRINFLGLQMVPVQENPRFRVLEEALEAVLHLNSLRFRCHHDFGFWHFGKAQGHYGLERLDRWSDGIQYGHQAIPWLLFLRGGSRRAYEEAMIQSRHAFDVAINKHYLDPDWAGRSVSESDFSASPFNWGKETLGLQSNLNFLAFYHHLGGQGRVQRLLQEYAMDMNEADAGDALPVGTHRLSNRARANFVPNALWALLVEEVGDDRDLTDPELPEALFAFEARWLERTFSIGDVIGDGPTDAWGPNYIPQSPDTGHERFDPEAAGVVSPFAQPQKGLERGFLIQWARGNILDSYWPYIFDHTNESGFVPESWRGLTRMEAIQLGPMLSSQTEDPLHARRSWTHADRIARVMPEWDGLVTDGAEPLGDGKIPPMQTQWFDEDSLRDLSHALLAGITARVQWDPEGTWSDDVFSDTVFELKDGCAHAWIQASSLEGAEAASLMFIGDSNSDDAEHPWSITIQIWALSTDGEVQSVLESPVVLSQPGIPERYIRENGTYVANGHLFPETYAQQVTLDVPGDGEQLLVSAYFQQEGSVDLNHKGFFQVLPMDTKARVVHERPVGANRNAPIGFASQGVSNHTKYDYFTGASVLVRLGEPGADGLHLFDLKAESTEPFSYRDGDGDPIQITQLATYDSLEGHMKKPVPVAAPPEEWLELTNTGQGSAQLGVYGYDTADESYTKRSPYVLPTHDVGLWFEPSDSAWRDGTDLPGCFE
ncbi:MAG: hypothetical protein CMH54_08265, partial [Myxococcales bacterium]|nr:hypothetical protein [Myxococcales bacterium]